MGFESISTGQADWPAFLEEQFPGFLLPETSRTRIHTDAARNFLKKLNVPTATLDLLRASTVLAAEGTQLLELVKKWVPDLLRVLPSRTEMYRRQWRGGFHGRLDIPRTQALRLSGQADGFVTLSRRRQIDLPENVFLRSVLSRSADLLRSLNDAKLLSAEWAQPFREMAPTLRYFLDRTALRDLPDELPSAHHTQAAQNARHTCYQHALTWHRSLFELLDARRDDAFIEMLAAGALLPSSEPKKFELACLVRLAMELSHTLVPAGWTQEHSIVHANRSEVMSFRHPSSARIDLYYDQAVIPVDPTKLGQRARGVSHYLGIDSSQRPDITLKITSAAGTVSHIVFEVKCTDDTRYMTQGYEEAIVYRHEYAEHLHEWPKAVLVTPRSMQGAPRRGDEVVAVGWRDLGQLLAGFVGTA
jgi:hypothetical protein